MASLGAGGSKCLEIKRVQNPFLYKQYVLLRKQTADKLKKTEDQVETTPLWHGTDIDSVTKITGGRFDRGHHGKNGQNVDVQGHMYMMQVRVVTGEYCVGNESMKYPPVKPSNPAEEFDTTVNDEQNPTIFVTYHDAAAYPDYIIKYI
ncbi:hypothetical protein EB796_004740 [Bugula neritina]|uniref:PARP catalytic domain-containing protein n=1 Tax=Bugula neritina TaxID=10212 RepID=A0A7J7KHJ8_BUGNE|nr:hypothetical protein EB796_004740 [Bugula neritina]